MAISLLVDGNQAARFLKVGAIGAGLNLSGYLRWRARQVWPAAKGQSRPLSSIWDGGPSHMDTFDPQGRTPAEFRGQFNSDKNECRGWSRSAEHLPKAGPIFCGPTSRDLARCDATRSALRGWGTEYVTRQRADSVAGISGLRRGGYQGIGAGGARRNLPPFVAIPNSNFSGPGLFWGVGGGGGGNSSAHSIRNQHAQSRRCPTAFAGFRSARSGPSRRSKRRSSCWAGPSDKGTFAASEFEQPNSDRPDRSPSRPCDH